MTYEHGRWVMNDDDSIMVNTAMQKAVETRLPVIRLYRKVQPVYPEQPHMMLPLVLHLLAQDILEEEPMPKSRNLNLLLAPDPVQEGANT
ncbi:hypothetical protein FACS1894137_14370 [Spirochaetia bacterium]|nr:hypothetical protein FACS1894137_14370 [Spirochaetia bacterium]